MTIATRDFSVFLDRDGVICNNIDGGHRSVDTIEGIPGSDRALRMLAQLNCNIFIVTNQSWIGERSMGGWEMSFSDMADNINILIIKRIKNIGGRITDLEMCHHHAFEKCKCRKPKDEMIWNLAERNKAILHLNKNSYMIGDARSDIAAGLLAGLTPYMVRTGRGVLESGKTNGPWHPYLQSILYNDLEQIVKEKIWPKHATTPYEPVETVKPV